jgi:hypothetical protein
VSASLAGSCRSLGLCPMEWGGAGSARSHCIFYIIFSAYDSHTTLDHVSFLHDTDLDHYYFTLFSYSEFWAPVKCSWRFPWWTFPTHLCKKVWLAPCRSQSSPGIAVPSPAICHAHTIFRQMTKFPLPLCLCTS